MLDDSDYLRDILLDTCTVIATQIRDAPDGVALNEIRSRMAVMINLMDPAPAGKVWTLTATPHHPRPLPFAG